MEGGLGLILRERLSRPDYSGLLIRKTLSTVLYSE
jgi:hypothetical protein